MVKCFKMKLISVSLILIIVNNYYFVDSANILFLMTVASPSHFIWIRPIINRLALNGHNVTAISVNVDKNPPENAHYIHLENTYNILYGNKTVQNDILKRSEENPFEATLSFYKFGLLGCIGATTSKGLDTLLEYPDTFQFDLIAYDFTCGPCLLGFLHKFKYPPLVSITAFNNPQFTADLIGGHKFASYIPHFTLKYDIDMNFYQRTINTLVHHFDSLYRHWIYLPKIQALSDKALDFTTPMLSELEKRTLLMLVNSNPVLDYPEVMTPNMVPVGGLQIVPPKKLPDDIKSFIDAGVKGTVLFAMGTNFKSNMLDQNKQMMFLEAFSQMPEYNFLWKFDANVLPKEPSLNVMVRSWLPQNDILADSNIKAFITHAGLLSTQEATWHGVPMIGIPIYCDQHRNLYKSEKAGVAKQLKLSALSTESIRSVILEILEDGKYLSNMKTRSKHFKDQSELPLERAVWWIEWALRNPNVTHMHSPVHHLGFWKTNSYDVFIMFLIISLLAVKFIHYLLCHTHDLITKDNNKKNR